MDAEKSWAAHCEREYHMSDGRFKLLFGDLPKEKFKAGYAAGLAAQSDGQVHYGVSIDGLGGAPTMCGVKFVAITSADALVTCPECLRLRGLAGMGEAPGTR